MELTKEIKECIDKCVLCWLATSSEENMPNVSPKEIFTYYGQDQIIIANIASPQTVKNIKINGQVCLSLIDIFIQKGLQIKGNAKVIDHTSIDFDQMEKTLVDLCDGQFPFRNIIAIRIEKVKPIVAPRYLLYPDTTEEEQIKEAKKTYGL